MQSAQTFVENKQVGREIALIHPQLQKRKHLARAQQKWIRFARITNIQEENRSHNAWEILHNTTMPDRRVEFDTLTTYSFKCSNSLPYTQQLK